MPPVSAARALDESVRQRARARAFEIGERLLRAPNAGGRGLAAAAGDAVAFLSLYRASGDQRFERAMHDAIKRAATGQFGARTGTFSGISGLRAAADLASEIEPRYAGLVERCDEFVEATVPVRLDDVRIVYGSFDVIEGWAGARLARCVRGPRPGDELTRLLLWLCGDWDRWACAHPGDPTVFPVHDLGIAHGIAGVLAAIALSLDDLDEAQARAVADTAIGLAESAIECDDYPAWPHSLELPPEPHYHAAWCYGTPGVAAALHAVATRLRDRTLEAFALDAQRRVSRRPASDWIVSELGLCHGLLGNALCFASAAEAADCDELRAAAERLTLDTLDALDATGGICYARNAGTAAPATCELLGISGVALGLLTLAGEAPADWMRLHALEPLR